LISVEDGEKVEILNFLEEIGTYEAALNILKNIIGR